MGVAQQQKEFLSHTGIKNCEKTAIAESHRGGSTAIQQWLKIANEESQYWNSEIYAVKKIANAEFPYCISAIYAVRKL